MYINNKQSKKQNKMAIKKFSFDYRQWEATADFKVDTAIFTNEHANATLEFFDWAYDEDNDPIEEVMKKYAREAIKIASFSNMTVSGVIEEFKELEGFAPIDGSLGITLILIDGIDFDEDDLYCKVTDFKE
jgi:hypothetical protein